MSTVVLWLSAVSAVAFLGFAGWLEAVRRTDSPGRPSTPETELAFFVGEMILRQVQAVLVGLALVALFSSMFAWLARRDSRPGRLAAAALGVEAIWLSQKVGPLLEGWTKPLAVVASPLSWLLLLLGAYLLALAITLEWQVRAKSGPTTDRRAPLRLTASMLAILATLVLAALVPRALRSLQAWRKQRDDQCLSSDDLATYCRGVEAIGVSESGHAMASLGGGIVAWDPHTGKKLWSTASSSLSGNARQQVLVTDDAARLVEIDRMGWATAHARAGGQNALECEPAQMTPVRKAGALSPDGKQIATVAHDVCTFDLATGVLDRRLATDCDGSDLAYSRDGATLWVACSQEIRAFDLATGRRWRSTIAADAAPTLPAVTGLAASTFDAIGVSQDGTRVFSLHKTPGGSGTTVRAWEARTGKLLSSVALDTAHDGRDRVAWFEPYLAIFDNLGGGVAVFDLRSGAAVHRFPVSVHAHSVAASRDGSVVAAGADFDFARRRGPTVQSWSAWSATSARDPTATR